jgi:hypothetical protein
LFGLRELWLRAAAPGSNGARLRSGGKPGNASGMVSTLCLPQAALALAITAASASASANPTPCHDDYDRWELAPTLHGSGGAVFLSGTRGVGLFGVGIQLGYTPKSDACYPPDYKSLPTAWIKVQTENVASIEPTAGLGYVLHLTGLCSQWRYTSTLIATFEVGGGYAFRAQDSSAVISGLLGIGARVRHPIRHRHSDPSLIVSDAVIFVEAAALPDEVTGFRITGGLRLDPVGLLYSQLRSE